MSAIQRFFETCEAVGMTHPEGDAFMVGILLACRHPEWAQALKVAADADTELASDYKARSEMEAEIDRFVRECPISQLS